MTEAINYRVMNFEFAWTVLRLKTEIAPAGKSIRSMLKGRKPPFKEGG